MRERISKFLTVESAVKVTAAAPSPGASGAVSQVSETASSVQSAVSWAGMGLASGSGRVVMGPEALPGALPGASAEELPPGAAVVLTQPVSRARVVTAQSAPRRIRFMGEAPFSLPGEGTGGYEVSVRKASVRGKVSGLTSVSPLRRMRVMWPSLPSAERRRKRTLGFLTAWRWA